MSSLLIWVMAMTIRNARSTNEKSHAGALLPVDSMFIVSLFPGATELGLSALVTALSATGALLAWYIIHERPEISARLREAVPLGVVARRLGVAPIYDFAIVRPAFWLSDRVLHRGIERAGIDGLVLRGSTRALRGLATGALRRAHSGLARGALLWMVLGCLAIASYLAA